MVATKVKVKKLDFGCDLTDGRFTVNQRESFVSRIVATFGDGPLVMTITEPQPEKTNSQLRLYHGPIMDLALLYIKDCGYNVGKREARALIEEINPHLAAEVLRENDTIPTSIRLGLSELSKDEMILAIDWTIQYLAENGFKNEHNADT